MAESMLDALLKQPRRMGARTASRNTLGINHPLAESSPVSRIPISMMPGGGPASGYTQEDLATLALPKETTLFSPLGYDITDKDLAKFGLATDALDLVPGAAVLGGLATGAGLLGRAVKGNRVAPESDEMMSAMLGPVMQRQGLLDDAMVTYHGSPYQFDALDPTKIGTGEGAQAYGHGAYVAQDPRVGGGYQKSVPYAQIKRKFLEEIPEDAEFDELMDLVDEGHFSPEQERVIRALEADDWLGFDYPSQAISEAYGGYLKQNFDPSPELVEAVEGTSGYLYEIDVPDEAIAKMLDWDAPLSEQSIANHFSESRATRPDGKQGVELIGAGPFEGLNVDGVDLSSSGSDFYRAVADDIGGQVGASNLINEAGIPGIKYFDQGSRAANDGTRNMVLFDELAKRARVLKRNDETIAQPSVDEFIGKLLDDGLPMDEASRMQRAQDMGFDTDAYHGTYSDIPEFSMDEKNRSHGIDRLGHWFDDSPETPSNLFASVMLEDPDAVAGPNIIPAKLRSKNPLVIASDTPTSPARAEYRAQQRKINNVNRRLRTLESGTPQHNAALTKRDQYEIARNKAEKEINGDSWDRLLEQIGDGERPSNEAVDAFRQRVAGEGYDSIVLQDTLADAASRDGTATTWRIMLDDKNIRSVNAAFDPAKRNSANLLATAAPIAATGLLSANALRGLYEPDALKDDEAMRRALLRN